MNSMGFVAATRRHTIPKWLPGASFRANVTPEYLGVGYIIGPRIAGIIVSGGVFSWLVLMPAIRFFGSLAPGAGALSQHDSDSADELPTSSGRVTSGPWARARWRRRA